jgi:alginate O-acetyltransferase complex protein AlgI
VLFNSYAFIFGFLPITLIVFFGLTKFRLINLAPTWLVITSLVFYAYWNVTYLPLLLISIGWNYFIGTFIQQLQPGSRTAKILLGIGICFNIGLLGYYKYANFFINSLEQLLNTDWRVSEIMLPLGISFYTFTQTAYLVDAYRGKTKNYNLIAYILFVTFFPHLIAGPILDDKDVIPQFSRLRNFIFSHKNLAMGFCLFTLGLFKKVIIADNLSPWVAPVFDHAAEVSFIEAWVGALSYTLQLYFDFSGYSDMAVGLGLMLNIKLPVNFDSPYKATSISDFWRRWHITLSNFLRDYLYIPLGGSRKGEARRYNNLFITMLLGGLWHGAGWTFVVWGGLHGIYLCINHWWRQHGKPLPKLIAWAITFLAVVISWVYFRAGSLSDAREIIKTMMGMKGIVLRQSYESALSWLTAFGVKFNQSQSYLDVSPKNLVILAGLVLCVTLLPNTQQIMQWFKPNWLWAVLVSSTAACCLLSLNRVSEFLYFQF